MYKYVKEYEKIETKKLKEQIKKEFTSMVEHTVEKLERLSAIVHVCHCRGEKIDWLPVIEIKEYLLDICADKISARAFMEFGKTLIGRQIYLMPIRDQNRYAGGRRVNYYDYRTDSMKLVEPIRLSNSKIRQVFNNGKIRKKQEQKEWYLKNIVNEKNERGIYIDKKEQQVLINVGCIKMSITKQQLKNCLKELDSKNSKTKNILIKKERISVIE